jgi:3-oxoadipate enol-lactonase
MPRPPRLGESLERYVGRLWALSAAPGFAESRPEAIEEVVRQTLERQTPRMQLVQQARALLAWGHADRLRRITAPTTIVHGRDDPLVDVANARALARLIPHSNYVELAGVGHLVPYEAPDELHEILIRATPLGNLSEVS